MIIVEYLIKRNAYLSWPIPDDLPLDSILLLGLLQLLLVVRGDFFRGQHDLLDVLASSNTSQDIDFRAESISII